MPHNTNYRAELDGGHLYIHLPEGPFLLDTGSHGSFGETKSCTLAGQVQAIDSSMMGVSMDTIRSHVREDCVGLLGMDVLGELPLMFDLSNQQIVVGDGSWDSVEPQARLGCKYQRIIGGVPALDVKLDGRATRAIFDTGAQYGYVLRASQCSGGTPAAPIQDFSPMLGDMSSESWDVDVELCPGPAGAPGRFRQRVGIMPPLGTQMLSLIGVGAIIGCGWLRNCRVGRHGAEGKMWVAA